MSAALQDLDARARWHLEIGYDPVDGMGAFIDADGDDEVGYLGELVTCWGCGGEGTEVFCVDDLCHGAGHCIHGDGDRPCRQCGGEGVL